MERKILITGIILAICISVIIGIVFIYSGTKSVANPVKAIPQDAAYILRLNGLSIAKLLKSDKTRVWEEISNLNAIQSINNEITILDSLISTNTKLADYSENNDIYISGHYSGGKHINHLTLISVPLNLDESDANDYLSGISPNIVSNFSMRKYEGKSIFSITLGSKRIIYLTLSNGILMYSSSPVLIEDAIRQTTLNISLLDNEDFFELISATGKNKDANLFIDFSQLGKLTSIIANTKYIAKFKNYTQFGNWSELDINLKSDLLLLNGFTYLKPNETTFISAVCDKNPIRLTIDKILPATTSAFIAFGLSEPEENYSNYLNYLREIDKLARYQANLTNLNTKYNLEFEKFFLSLLDNEIALTYKDDPNTEGGIQYIILKCKSGRDAEKQLLNLTEKISLINDAAKTRKYSPDNSVHYNIHKIPIYPLFGRLIGDMFDVFEENHLCVVDNYLVVAGTYEEASQFIYDYMLRKTLANDEIYRDFAENTSMKSFVLGYINLAKADNYFQKYLHNDFIANWKENKPYFTNVQAAGFQISEVSDLPYFNIFLKRLGNYRGRPQTVWESLLDTSISSKPSFVENHYSKQKEIFVQDDKNNVYLVNQAGRILWTFLLPEKINSDIYQIDYYKNGKLQMLFSTKSSIHLIDRNGNYVEKYPIRLRAEATSGLSVFDYEKDKNYRIFIPCVDKKVYAYKKDGTIISGWTFSGSDHHVEKSVKYFRIENKDFIVFADKNKTYILDRKGNERIIIKKPFSISAKNNIHVHQTNQVSSSYFLTTTSEGKLIKIYLDGNTEELELSELSPNHYFDYNDVNADGKSDYIILDNNQLYVFGNAGELIFKYETKSAITKRPVYYHFSHSNRKIGLVSETEEKIYLINNNGKLYNNFPLEGKTLFSIGYFDITSSRFNLIVGGRNNFLYNYAVE